MRRRSFLKENKLKTQRGIIMGEEARKSEKSCSVPRLVWGGGRGGMGVTARGPHTPWLKSHQYYGGGAPPTGPHPKVKQSPSRCLWGVGRGFLCPPPLGGGFIGDGSLHPTTPASPAPPRPGPKEKPPQNGGISRSKVQTRDRGGGTGYRGTPPPHKTPPGTSDPPAKNNKGHPGRN